MSALHHRLFLRFTTCLMLVLTTSALFAAGAPQSAPRKSGLTPEQIDSIRQWAEQTDKLKSFQETFLEALDGNTFNDRLKPYFEQLGKWTERVNLITALANTKEGEYIKSKIRTAAEEAIWKQLTRRLPAYLVNGLNGFSWAKSGMELFKDFVVDPALLDYGLDIYSNNRKALDPADAFANTRILGTVGQEVRKDFLKQLGPEAFVNGEKGEELLPRWEQYFKTNFNRFIASWYEMEYQKRLLAEAKAALEKEKVLLLAQEDGFVEQLIGYLSSLQEEQRNQAEEGFGKPGGAVSDRDSGPRPLEITFGQPVLKPSRSAYDVGDEIHISLPYEVTGSLKDKHLELVRKFRITGQSASLPGDEGWEMERSAAVAGAATFSRSFRVPPGFAAGEYRIEIVFEMAGIAIKPPPALGFQVSGLYAGAVYLLREGENRIEQCQPLDGEALLQQVPAAIRTKASPLYAALRDRAEAAIARAQAMAGQMASNIDTLYLAEDLLNHCKTESTLQTLARLDFAGLPASCVDPLRGEAESLRGRAQERIATQAKIVALLGAGEHALAEGRPDEARDSGNKAIAAIDNSPAAACYSEQRASAETLLTPITPQEPVSVAITGPRQALQGQQVHLGSSITLGGTPVQDPDAYAYRWEAANGKSVTGQKSVTFIPRTPGEKVLRLTVTGPRGRSATTSATLFVPRRLQINIGADKAEALTDEKVTMAAAVNAEQELCPCRFTWRAAGIGQAFTAPSVWLDYQQPGQYAVTLEVVDRFGQTASASHTLVVKAGEKGNRAHPLASQRDQAQREKLQREKESLERERERYQARERERLERERREQARLERERREQARREEAQRRRQEQARQQQAEAERYRREQQRREQQENDPFFGDLRNRPESANDRSGSNFGEALTNVIKQIGRANEEHRRERERIEQEWREEQRQIEAQERRERAQREKEQRREQERQEAARAKCEQERQSLRNRLADWQKGLACLEEGKRKHPRKWLDCNGHWTMRDREVEIETLRQNISNGQSRLNSLYCG